MDYSELPERMLKRSILALLMRLSTADNDSHAREHAYMEAVCEAIDLPVGDLEEVRANLEDYPLDPPSDEPQRMQILYFLLFQMKIDHKVTDEEVAIIQKFGFILGFREQLVEDLISVIKDHTDKLVPPDALIDVIRNYQN